MGLLNFSKFVGTIHIVFYNKVIKKIKYYIYVDRKYVLISEKFKTSVNLFQIL